MQSRSFQQSSGGNNETNDETTRKKETFEQRSLTLSIFITFIVIVCQNIMIMMIKWLLNKNIIFYFKN